MNEEEIRAWLHLLRADGVGPILATRLVTAHGSALAAVNAGAAAWKRLGLPAAACAALARPDPQAVDQDWAWLAGGDHRHLLPITDARYPQRLREVESAPAALFCIGDLDLLRQPQIAVVGARSATAQGLDTAHAFAAELVKRGLVVTSGMALGIDAAAHRGALSANGPTIALCGTGLDRVYPARHKELAHAIAAQGLLVSEFSPGMPPLPENFPRRNRLIAGLSLGILVVEAARESGSLITARLAVEQGREVFAVPGSIHNPLARGCHQLLRQGAKLAESVDDIIEELAGALAGALRDLAEPSAEPGAATVTDAPARDLQAVWQAIGDSPITIDQLTERLPAAGETLNEALLRLELEGWIASDHSGRLMRRNRASV